MKAEDLGKQISEIVTQDGEDKTDGQIVDEIVELLKLNGMWYPRI